MNNLSWLIYISGIASNVQGLLILVGVALLCITPFICIGADMECDEEKKKIKFKSALKPLKVSVVFFALSAIVPSSTAIKLIAASEVGGTAVMSKDGQEILNDVRTIIKQQIKGLKK